ncbi:MAG: helix-turn-helix domain-containing protein [Oscillospiraceae bacterium]|jgi:SOS-response transcriptional repressor LexA|nr:helix-turn-helix domain-containing protein [Oscillospiraceae bacterium]
MFIQTLNHLLNEKEISKAELSRRAEIPYTTIDGWYKKSAEGVRLDTLQKLATFFDVSIDYLVNGKTNSFSLEETRIINKYRKLDAHGKTVTQLVLDEENKRMAAEKLNQITYKEAVEDARMIPLFLTAAAAGLAAPTEGEDYEMVALPPSAPRRTQFAVKISGDSMEPAILDGQIVFCSKEGGLGLRNGDIGIFCVDGAYYCKKYRTDGENVFLTSINRKRSDSDITIWSGGNRRLIFLGKVLD